MNNNLVYNLSTLNSINSVDVGVSIVIIQKIVNKFWKPNDKIISKLINYCETNKFKNILEVGPGQPLFQKLIILLILLIKLKIIILRLILIMKNFHFQIIFLILFIVDMSLKIFKIQ